MTMIRSPLQKQPKFNVHICFGALTWKSKIQAKKQEHYFGALTNDQCSKIKFLFCLAALFWKLQKGDAP